jgi:hypothetical protein
MPAWEYQFIFTSRGEIDVVKAFANFFKDVRKAGDEGWEAIGEVTVKSATQTRDTVLMFKRPIDVP